MARISIDLPQSFHFSTEVPVRIDDINYRGHLGNDAMLSILQEARIRMLQDHGWSEVDIEGVGIIMGDAALIYKSESFHDDVLVIEIGVVDITRSACDFVYRVSNKATGREVAIVKTGLVFFDYASRKIVGVPERFKKIFNSL